MKIGFVKRYLTLFMSTYNNTLQPEVGVKVLARSKGEPYLAGIVHSVIQSNVWVEFPHLGKHYMYDKTQVIPYRSQFENGKFIPLIYVPKTKRQYVRKKILEYEKALL